MDRLITTLEIDIPKLKGQIEMLRKEADELEDTPKLDDAKRPRDLKDMSFLRYYWHCPQLKSQLQELENRPNMKKYLEMKNNLAALNDSLSSARMRISQLQTEKLQSEDSISKIKQDVKALLVAFNKRKEDMNRAKAELQTCEVTLSKKSVEFKDSEEKFAQYAGQLSKLQGKVGISVCHI